MAIKQLLSKEDKTNSYGIDLQDAYFKIEDVSTDFGLGQIKIYVRGYATKEARAMQKDIETNRALYQKLSMGSTEFDKAFEKSDYTKEDEYRTYIEEQQELYTQNIIGIYKEKFEVNIDDLNITSFTEEGIKTACYIYLKTLDIFNKGVDC